MTFLKFGAVAVLGFLSLTSFLATDSVAQGRQNGPVFSVIAGDLGISEDEAESCFPQRDRGSKRDSIARPGRPDIQAVVECLAKTSTALSAQEIQTVLKESHARGGKAANRG